MANTKTAVRARILDLCAQRQITVNRLATISGEDLHRMGQLWREILRTPYQEIDYQAMVATIKALRSKYEQPEHHCAVQGYRNLA